MDSEDAKTSASDRLLKAIAEQTVYSTGLEFLRALTRTLAQTLNVRYSFVSEFIENNSVARILTFWNGAHVDEGRQYSLPNTPCETVLGGEIAYFTDRVQDIYPREKPLGVEGYLAIPLLSENGEVMGHLAAMDTKPMLLQEHDFDAFKIFGARACAELQRKHFEDALKASEERVTRILDSAMDAIIAIDGERRISLFNPAAERIFGCAAGWAVGQPFDRFLSKPFRSLMDNFLREADQAGAHARPMWATEGLTALRANREEFPIEGTIAAVIDASGNKSYTLILRDVNERIRTQAEIDRLQQQNVFLQDEVKGKYKFEEMVGNTAVMKQLFEVLESVARSDATVLVYGETGTGKEQIAHAVHNLSARKDALLIKMNCAALPSELIESEMFGHEKGAFTGATAQRKGRFEMADGGTLFLDEVGELTPPAQAKLLRVLQQQEFERVGGTRTVRVDVRVIAATNRDLNEMVQAGAFRADLYYRLNVFPVQVPPLRQRVEDIPLLVDHFIGKYARKLGRNFTGIDPDSMQRLMRYSWPGNIRELQNIIERAVVLSSGPVVIIRDVLSGDLAKPGNDRVSADTLLRTLEDVETEHIRGVLQQCEWVIEGKRGAAAILGLEPSTLRYRMQKLGITRPRSVNSET